MHELTITVPSTHIIAVLQYLKSATFSYYEQLRDITGIDHVKQDLRFEVVYQLLSITNTKRLIISVFTSEGSALTSVTSIYSSAG